MIGFVATVVGTGLALWVTSLIYKDISFGPDPQTSTILIVAVIFGVVNAVIKPIIKLLSLPLTLMTFGLFGLVINGGPAHPPRLARRPRRADLQRRWLPAGLQHRHDHRRARRRGRPEHRLDSHRLRPVPQPEQVAPPTRSAPRRRRLGHRWPEPDACRSSPRRSARRRAGSGRRSTSPRRRAWRPRRTSSAPRSPTRGSAQYSVKANDVAGDRRPARGARASGRTSCRAASGRSPGGPGSRTSGSPSRASARPTPTAGRGPGRRPRRAAPLGRGRVAPTRPRPRARLARRAPGDGSTCSCGSTRRSSPRRMHGLAVGAGSSKFGLADDELAGAIEAGGGADGPAALARDPPPRRLAARGGRRLARRGPTGARAARAARRRAARLRHARRRRRLPGRRPGDAVPRPERFARELPGAARGRAGRPATDAAGDRAGSVPRRPGRLARRRASSTSASAAGRWSSSTPG